MKNNKDDKNIETFLGMTMRWDRKNAFKNLWNKEDDRVFPPKYFGIGLDINLHALLKKTGILTRIKK